MGHSVVFVNRGEHVGGVVFDALSLNVLGQSSVEVIVGREHNGRSSVVLHVCRVSHTIVSEGSLAQVEDFLRSSTALNGERRAVEDSIATAESVSQH